MTYDTYINFENEKTKLNEETFNKLQDLIKKDIRENGGGGGDSEEIGSVKLWFSNTIPANWLLCSGQEVSRTEYSELFEILGTIYGEGDSSTTFNLPDMRECVPAGLDINSDTFDELGKKVGEKKHEMTIEELVEHNHDTGKINSGIHAEQGASTAIMVYKNEDGQIPSGSTGGSQPFNIIQPSFVTNFIIKAKKEKVVAEEITLSEVLEEIIKQENEESTDTNTYSAKAIDEMNTYSTQEINTGKMWIDGKTIYRKVINITSDITDGFSYNHNITNLDKVVKIDGTCNVDSTTFMPLNHCLYSSGTTFSSTVTITSSLLRFYLSTARNTLFGARVIIEYTKTTD